MDSRVELECSARGAPDPKVTWKKELGECAGGAISNGVKKHPASEYENEL